MPATMRPASAPAATPDSYAQVRDLTVRLAAPLSDADATLQSMPDASPAKWHLAHTTWFFETFLLIPYSDGYRVFDDSYNYLFNSYYDAVGARHARPRRGMLSRPTLDDVLAYRGHVDAAMEGLLAEGRAPADLIALGLHHEQQHQELLLTDILNAFAENPTRPAYRPPGPLEVKVMRFDPGWTYFDGGLAEIGAKAEGFSFDCERPRHKSYITPFRLKNRAITNGEWKAFIEAGGYGSPHFWLSDGWATCQREGWQAPLYWRQIGRAWHVMTLRGLQLVDDDAPVTHVSYFEADAFATWSGCRLPTEQEWELAAEDVPIDDCRLMSDRLRPAPQEGRNRGLRGMYGDVWEWTRSAFLPYPGYQVADGAVGEYNGKFMSGQMVLRGGSCVTPPGHMRPSYRNFFHPDKRWQFSGLRLAQDACAKGGHAQTLFLNEALCGLTRAQKTMSPKWFYDAAGSALFEQITHVPEYYPTRTEAAIFPKALPELALMMGHDLAIAEYGSGASVKTRALLDFLAPQQYIPIDISEDFLNETADQLQTDYPDIDVQPVVADFTADIALPASFHTARQRMGFFPGSTIGNMSPAHAMAFLRRARTMLGTGSTFLLGVDLVKDIDVLEAAYDDARGVTAAFNKNLLVRMNSELGADFDLGQFTHRAHFNADQSRIEMHLVSLRPQHVRLGGQRIAFRAGETIHTENSYKYTTEGIDHLAAQSGWRVETHWTDDQNWFGLYLLVQD